MAQAAGRKKSTPATQAGTTWRYDSGSRGGCRRVGWRPGADQPIPCGNARGRAGLAVVVIQHLDPTSESMLPPVAGTAVRAECVASQDGIALQPNRSPYHPPAVFLSMESGRLRFRRRKPARARMPIDVFLHSLAADRGSAWDRHHHVRHRHGRRRRAEGTEGNGRPRAGARSNEAQHDGMPRYAIRTARPDYTFSQFETCRLS
jgi:two-component system CheB/CheR fusion protein